MVVEQVVETRQHQLISYSPQAPKSGAFNLEQFKPLLKNTDKLFYCLLLILFLLPIPLGSNRPWAWNSFQIAIFLLTLCCVFAHRKEPMLGMHAYRRVLYFWLPIIIIATIQIIEFPQQFVGFLSPNAEIIQATVSVDSFYFSLDIGQSIISYFKLLSYFCMFCCVLMLVNSERRLKLLLLCITISGTFQAIYGVSEVLLGVDKSLIFEIDVKGAATGTYIYKNHYANLLIMTAAAAIGLLVTSLQKDRHKSPKDWLRSFASAMLSSKGLIRISVVIMVIALVMSRSRMGNTAFFAAMTIVGFAALYLIRNKSKGLQFLVMSMFVIDLMIVSTYFGLEKVQQRLISTSFEQESRDEVIKDASLIIFDYPIIGTGGGSFYSIFPSYQKAEVHSFYDHAHNDYLQMAIEYGLPAFFIMACMSVFLFYKAIRPMYRRRQSIFKGTSFSCSMVMIGMFVHMTVDFPLQAYANACYFMVFLALAMIINSLKISTSGSKEDSTFSKFTV